LIFRPGIEGYCGTAFTISGDGDRVIKFNRTIGNFRAGGQVYCVQALVGDDAGTGCVLCFRHEIERVRRAINYWCAEDADVRENAVSENIGGGVEGFARRNELRMPPVAAKTAL
jgi:hypothetical protein